MQILTKLTLDEFGVAIPSKEKVGKVAMELKNKTEKFKSFFQTPFKAEVLVVETAEDHLE